MDVGSNKREREKQRERVRGGEEATSGEFFTWCHICQMNGKQNELFDGHVCFGFPISLSLPYFHGE